MKVLHVIGGVAWRYGGTTATVLPLCEALNRKPGYVVEIATTDADGRGRRLAPEDTPKTTVPLRLFRRNYSERWKLSLNLLRWLWWHARDYDLIHIHAVWSFATAAASWAARWNQVPYVVMPQGMLSPYSWSRSSGTKWLYWQLLERTNVVQAARLIVTSTGEHEEIRRLGLPIPLTTVTLGLGPDAWQTPARPDYLRQRCQGRDRGRPVVLYLSRLHPKKGVAEFLLPAFKALKNDAFLVIAGGPDPHSPEYANHVHATVAQLGLRDRVALLGPVSAEDRWALFDGADLFALPSRNENFGLVVIEAMARGCPVVVSREAFACEHVTAAGAGKVVPLTLPELTAALDALLEDPAARAEMGRRGKAYAPRLSWDQVADTLAAMYTECLAEYQAR
jgi:glycosyltransferase involved in cell wall biosynthesis